MPDEFNTQEEWKKDQLEDDREAECQEPHDDRGPVSRVAEFLLEMFNPFEAFCEHPGFGLVLLVFVAAAVVIVFIGTGLWAAVQETFLGGGPPQTLGLK